MFQSSIDVIANLFWMFSIPEWYWEVFMWMDGKIGGSRLMDKMMGWVHLSVNMYVDILHSVIYWSRIGNTMCDMVGSHVEMGLLGF